MAGSLEWLLLAYRMPREPSTPRIAVWRKLTSLGVAKLGDGLVGLPADARSQERLEWIADEVAEAGGEATLWQGRAVLGGGGGGAGGGGGGGGGAGGPGAGCAPPGGPPGSGTRPTWTMSASTRRRPGAWMCCAGGCR